MNLGDRFKEHPTAQSSVELKQRRRKIFGDAGHNSWNGGTKLTTSAEKGDNTGENTLSQV